MPFEWQLAEAQAIFTHLRFENKTMIFGLFLARFWHSYTCIPGYSIVPYQRVSSYAIQVAMCA